MLVVLVDILEQEEEGAISQSKITAEHHHLCERGAKTLRPQPRQAESPAVSPEIGDRGGPWEIIMWSPEGRKIIPVELTGPWAVGGCSNLYQQLVQDCQDKGSTLAEDGGSRRMRIPSPICV